MPLPDGVNPAPATAATVLVVDDESHISHVVSIKLRQAGLRVVVASDGEEALDLAAAERPALVISDFQMPLMNGLELAKSLRRAPDLARVPVLLVTARGHLIPPEELAQTNIRAVIAKPFAPRLLLQKALELLEASAGGLGVRREAPGAAAA
jgi:CheY-like chemotaxis protein